MTTPVTRDLRLQELSLFVTAQAVSNESFSETGLRDVLFLLDSLAQAELGHPLTGFSYRKTPSGPDVVNLDVTAITSDLAKVQLADIGATEEMLVALRPPDMSIFSEKELALIERVVNQLKDSPPAELAYYSYGWMSKYEHALPGFPVPSDSALIFT